MCEEKALVTVRKRDAAKSKSDILNAAENEFSEKGFYGTRVDEIANKANINKGMIYQYFGSKEILYQEVLTTVYGRLAERESIYFSNKRSSIDMIKEMIEMYFEFLRDNPTYVNLLMWENLNKGKYIENIDAAKLRNPSYETLKKIIENGKSEKVFKQSVDTEQVIHSMLMYTYANFTNLYTYSKLIGKNFADPENMKKRIADLTEMILEHIIQK